MKSYNIYNLLSICMYVCMYMYVRTYVCIHIYEAFSLCGVVERNKVLPLLPALGCCSSPLTGAVTGVAEGAVLTAGVGAGAGDSEGGDGKLEGGVSVYCSTVSNNSSAEAKSSPAKQVTKINSMAKCSTALELVQNCSYICPKRHTVCCFYSLQDCFRN